MDLIIDIGITLFLPLGYSTSAELVLEYAAASRIKGGKKEKEKERKKANKRYLK